MKTCRSSARCSSRLISDRPKKDRLRVLTHRYLSDRSSTKETTCELAQASTEVSLLGEPDPSYLDQTELEP